MTAAWRTCGRCGFQHPANGACRDRAPPPPARPFLPPDQVAALWAASNVVASRLDRLEASLAEQGRLTDELLEACHALRAVVRGP